jgi:uncharacterized membrane-anchored protein
MTFMLDRLAGDRHPAAAKVPEITAIFWLIKVLTTGIGETASDFLGQKSIPLAALVGVAGIAVGLRLQLQTTTYRAPRYWFAVLMVAVFGTMAADGLHKGLGLPYAATTVFYALAVAVIFLVWHRVEGTLSIHSITTRRRERFYWSAVLATFALGTAVGDLTAITLHLGYLGSAALFAVVIAVPGLAWWRLDLNAVVTFWACYVVTRPLGASVADWVGKPLDRTGLGLGDGPVTALGLAAFAALVAYVAATRLDVQQPASAQGGAQHHRRRAGHHEGAQGQVQPAEG